MLKSNMFAEGGVMQEGGTVDPVSGNNVPPGAMQEEVRDDIPAQLSEGEFVFSADVVRYWGLEKLMALRDKAKAGLKKMEDIGQMGNADQVEDPEALHGGEEMDDDAFSAEVDDIIGETDAEAMGGTREFNRGGLATPGTDYLAKYNIPRTAITNPALDVRAYKNADGRIMYITFFNGKPSTPIPAGFEFVGTGQEMQTTLKKEEEKPADVVTAVDTTQVDQGGGGDGFDSSPTGSTGGGFTATDPDGQAMASTVAPSTVAAGLTALSLAMGVPAVATPTGMVTGFVTDALNSLSHSLAAAANVSAQGSPGAVDSFSQASSTAPTATTGATGTGGAAAAAAAAAASAAAANGLSDAAQGAASQAAASATVAGATPSEAAAAGQAAAADAAMSEAVEGAVAAEAEAGFTAPGMDAGQPDGGESEGSVGDTSGGYGEDAGFGLAKGGLVSKRKKPTKSTKQKGLAARR